MANPEIPKNAPASTSKSPSDTLLKNFQSTLEKRWAEFDIATMKEAQAQVAIHPLWGLANTKKERDTDANFIKAKAAFDQARVSLDAVRDDVGLKQILNSPGNLLSAIQTLEAHFALATAPEKAKEYNHVLANTLADLTSLRSQVTDTAEDKKAAEVAAVAVKAMPAVAVAAIATGGAESLLSGADAKWLLSEGSKEIKTGIKSFIAETLGFDKKTMIEDIAKRAKWESIGFMGTIRVMIFAMLSKISFLGMTDDWSPEEMRLAGISTPVVKGEPEKLKEWTKQETEQFLSAKSYDMTSKLLIYGVSREKFDTALGGAVGAVKDATWWLDDTKRKEATMTAAIVTISLAKVQEKNYWELKSLGESGILSLLGQSKPEERAAVKLFLDMMGKQESRFDTVFQWEDWKLLPLKSLISKLYKKEWYDKVESLTDVIKDFDPSKMATISGDIFTKIWKNENGEYIISGILGSQYELLKSQGIGVAFLGKILDTAKWWQSVNAFMGNMKNEKFSQAETIFLEKVLSKQYIEVLKISMKTRFGFTDELIWQIWSDTISVKDIFELYAITWGDTDISKLDKWRKALIFTKMQMYLGNKDPNALGWYLAKLTQEGAEKYPDAVEIGNMIDSTVNYGVYKATFAAISGWEKLLDGLLGTMDIDTRNRILKSIWLAWGTTWLIWIAIKLTPVWRIASIISILLATLGISTVTALQASGKK